MKTSVIIISVLLVLSVFVPFFLFIYNGSKQTIKIKKQVKTLLKNSYLNYGQQEIWRKNFMGINSNDQILTYINFKTAQPSITNINFNELENCKIVNTHTSGKGKNRSLKQLGLELTLKPGKNKTTICFFDKDEDVTEDYEMQRIEKWHTLIKQAITPANSLIKQAS